MFLNNIRKYNYRFLEVLFYKCELDKDYSNEYFNLNVENFERF